MFRAMFPITLAVGLILAAPFAVADVVNGDFESGGVGWSASTTDPYIGVNFLATGGNPDGCVLLAADHANSGGRTCISQSFVCGEPGGTSTCRISFDYGIPLVIGGIESGDLIVSVDGDETVVPFSDVWNSYYVDVPCGQHILEFCLEVLPSGNLWDARVDNVSSLCMGTVPDAKLDWGSIKAQYR